MKNDSKPAQLGRKAPATTAAGDMPFISPGAEAVARVEPADLSRFEGEGGLEAPERTAPLYRENCELQK